MIGQIEFITCIVTETESVFANNRSKVCFQLITRLSLRENVNPCTQNFESASKCNDKSLSQIGMVDFYHDQYKRVRAFKSPPVIQILPTTVKYY